MCIIRAISDWGIKSISWNTSHNRPPKNMEWKSYVVSTGALSWFTSCHVWSPSHSTLSSDAIRSSELLLEFNKLSSDGIRSSELLLAFNKLSSDAMRSSELHLAFKSCHNIPMTCFNYQEMRNTNHRNNQKIECKSLCSMEPEAINILCANDKVFGRSRNNQQILCKL